MEGLREKKKSNNGKFHLTGDLGLMVQKASHGSGRIQEHSVLKHAKACRNLPEGMVLCLCISHQINSWFFSNAWAQWQTGVS